MKLTYLYADGLTKEDALNFVSYSAALKAAGIALKGAYPRPVSARLRADYDGRMLRHYHLDFSGLVATSIPGPSRVIPPPTMFPGVWLEGRPEFPCDGIVRLSEAAYEHELNEADRKGYERGFRDAGHYPKWTTDIPVYIQGSVRAGVRGATREQSLTRPDFTVDTGHNRKL